MLSDFVKKNKLMFMVFVKVYFVGEDIVVLCDIGLGGMSMGVSLINEDVCSWWCCKLGRRIMLNICKFIIVVG